MMLTVFDESDDTVASAWFAVDGTGISFDHALRKVRDQMREAKLLKAVPHWTGR